MGKIKVDQIEKHDATEVTVNSDVVMAAGTSVSSPSISTDTISEKTAASGVTIDGLLIKDGAIPSIAGGKVLQVIQATTSTATEVASTTYADSGLTADITPSATDSKVLVIVSQNIQISISDNGLKGYMKLLRDSTDIVTDSIIQILTGGASSNLMQLSHSIVYLDSPSTTSAITYKTQIKVNDTSSSGKIRAQDESSPSQITLIEVSA